MSGAGHRRSDHGVVFPAGVEACDRMLADNRRPAESYPAFCGGLSLTVGYSKFSDESDIERFYLVSRGADPGAIRDAHEKWAAGTTTAEKRRALARLRKAIPALDGVLAIDYGRRRDRVHIRLPAATKRAAVTMVPILSKDIGEQIRASTAAVLAADPSRGTLQVFIALIAAVLLVGRFEADLNMVDVAASAGVSRYDIPRRMHELYRSGALKYWPGVGRRPSHVLFECHPPIPDVEPGRVCLEGRWPPVPEDADDWAEDDDNEPSNLGNLTLARHEASWENGPSKLGKPAPYVGKTVPGSWENPRSLDTPEDRSPRTDTQANASACDPDYCQFYDDGECVHHGQVGAP